MTPIFALTFSLVLLIISTVFVFLSRYKKCPSDKVLVVYGKLADKQGIAQSAKCLHGGAAFVWPIIQDYQYLDLTPIPIDIKLEGALSKQNIRVNTPSTFIVGISTESGVMENAAERVLGLSQEEIQNLAKDIIFGQMRVVIATMPIEEINADRDKLISNISEGVEGELQKIGLRLINVNVQDITDESGYIDALGKEAASRAINEAKMKVAERDRDGSIGAANAQREQRIKVAEADATAEIGEAKAMQEQRIEVSTANARAVEGENTAKIDIANSDALRRKAEAEATRIAMTAEKVKAAQALEESYKAEELAEKQRADREKASQYANIVVPAEIEKKKIETLAAAEAQKIRIQKQGEADGIKSILTAQAEGAFEILTKKAEGFKELVSACENNANYAALMMITEKLPEIIAEQVKAISNLKIDSVTVWDSGSNAEGKSSTANFVSSLVGSLPPLHDILKNTGIQLPEYLGKIADKKSENKPKEPEQTPEKKE